jgi:23S rRNA pseudouridine2605 synthase
VAVPLVRALSKLGILSRAQAGDAIRHGRVRVDGQVVRDPRAPVTPERARIELDGVRHRRTAWRTVVLHKPRGVVTTRRDPEGRRTVYDLLGPDGAALIPVGRLDFATSGLLILTNDTQLANALTDPAQAVPRVYVVTVRGDITADDLQALRNGAISRGERLQPSAVQLRKRSKRESHLTIELREGRNREVRRLFEAIGHEVTRLKRIQFGPLALGDLAPGEWREVRREEFGAGTRGRAGRAGSAGKAGRSDA